MPQALSLAVALVTASLVIGWQSAAAAASAKATPAAAPDSYSVSGAGFTPGSSVTVYDASGCGGEALCPGDNFVGKAKVAADGSFAVTVQLDTTFKPSAGQTHRAIEVAQDDWTAEQLKAAPLVQLPLKHSGTVVPGAPNTGSGFEQAGGSGLGVPTAALLVMVAIATFLAGTGLGSTIGGGSRGRTGR